MARTVQQIVEQQLGLLLLQIATLTAQIEALTEAQAEGRHDDGVPPAITRDSEPRVG